MLYIMGWLFGAKDIEEEHDKDISRRIWNLLRAERTEDSIIQQLYDSESAYVVMKNSISYFSSRLSDSFCRMVNTDRSVIRENFNYKVKINFNRKTDRYSLRQHIKYIRHFSKSEIRPMYIRCCFTYDSNALRTAFKDSSFFFREELEDTMLIERIRNLMSSGKNKDVLSELDYDLSLFDLNGNEVEVAYQDIEVSDLCHPKTGVPIGVVFTYSMPPTQYPLYVSNSKDGKVSYTASVKCKYPIPSISRFLCVFSGPVIGRTKFTIEFDDDIINNAHDDVQIDQFLTTPDLDKQKICYPDAYEVQFETQETIFPTSAILTRWSAKK